MSVYLKLKKAGIKTDHHESDLYCEANQLSIKILKDHGIKFKTFVDNIEGKIWLDIPFMYDPFWGKEPEKCHPAS
jgi:hypothetical protein